MKIVIFGYQQHGKDSACEYLQSAYGLTFTSSSWYACQAFLFEQLRHSMGYETIEQCFADRTNHRPLWYQAIRTYNDADRARLGREIFSGHDVYCGIRDREEFECLRAQGLFDLAIWIDACKRKPPESSASMNLSPDDADVILSNNDDLTSLHRRLDCLMNRLGLFQRLCSVSKSPLEGLAAARLVEG